MKKLNNDPVIVSFARTPIGKYAGALKDIRPDDMLAHVYKHVVQKIALKTQDIDEFIAGCANQAGEDNRNVARMAQLLAGFPSESSALTVNRLCASGLDAITAAARLIITKEAHVVVAGGVESMSRAPYVMAKSNKAYNLGAPALFDSSLGWRFFNQAMKERTPPEHNGVTAERLAQKYKISRESQDKFALFSHEKFQKAQKANFFSNEIISIKNLDQEIFHDEQPRADSNLEKLAKLKAAFVEHGSVTAGNSSSLNDGAAALVITSHEYARAHGIEPLARILGFASAGVDPQVMGLGPVPATYKLLQFTGLDLSSFDAIEINEAFAAQVLAVMHELKFDEERVNNNGGALALGHPLGCSGARIVLTLVNNLRSIKKNLGLATLCVGVGQGVSMAIEAL